MPYDCQLTGMQRNYFAAGTGGEVAGKSRLGLPARAKSGCTGLVYSNGEIPGIGQGTRGPHEGWATLKAGRAAIA